MTQAKARCAGALDCLLGRPGIVIVCGAESALRGRNAISIRNFEEKRVPELSQFNFDMSTGSLDEAARRLTPCIQIAALQDVAAIVHAALLRLIYVQHVFSCVALC